MLCLSPWLKLEGLVSLMDNCKCSTGLMDEPFERDSPLGHLVTQRHEIKQSTVSILEEWITCADTKPRYSYTKRWYQAADNDVVICHTSETTGKSM